MPDLLEHHRSVRLPHPHRTPPASWRTFHASIKRRWAMPFLYLDWLSQWAVFGLSRFSFLELLEYCWGFSILIAVIFYFAESDQRRQTRHYQAWQVINTAQGKGGSGGRIDALGQLNDDHVPLIGVDVSGAFLQSVRLDHASLNRGNFAAADLRQAHLARADLEFAFMNGANLREADLTRAVLSDAKLSDADLSGADLNRTVLDRADLRNADLSEIKNWQQIAGISGANIAGVQNPPAGFSEWAISHGAIADQATTQK
jgi:uncharacterized protein YjbI with pentapeptide repeats